MTLPMNEAVYEPTHQEELWAESVFAPNPQSRDPIHAEWFFWDETWTFRHGPYESEGVAREALEEYVRTALG